MIVLSLFDGMSCGQIALKELGAHVERYYASEVDKFAIAQTQLNFPETVQLGDVRNIDARKLGHVDLLLGGSPCQSFSFARRTAIPQRLYGGNTGTGGSGRTTKKCGNCALCIHTHLGGECQLTDNPVEYEQDGCIDHIPED